MARFKTSLKGVLSQIGVAVALAACGASVKAGSIVLTPVADAFVSTAQSSRNYGGAGALSVAAPGLADGGFESVLRFNTAAAKTSFDAEFGPGNWTISGASLGLNAAFPMHPTFNATSAGSMSITWMENDLWVEGFGTPNFSSAQGITFATLPSFISANDQSLGVYAFDGSTSGTREYALGLPLGFADDAQSGGLVSLRLAAGDATVSYLFNARNFNNPATWPALTLTAVPEPGTAMLVCALLAGLAARRRRAR